MPPCIIRHFLEWLSRRVCEHCSQCSLGSSTASENGHPNSTPGLQVCVCVSERLWDLVAPLMFSGFAPGCLDGLGFCLLIRMSTRWTAETHLSSAWRVSPPPYRGFCIPESFCGPPLLRLEASFSLLLPRVGVWNWKGDKCMCSVCRLDPLSRHSSFHPSRLNFSF